MTYTKDKITYNKNTKEATQRGDPRIDYSGNRTHDLQDKSDVLPVTLYNRL